MTTTIAAAVAVAASVGLFVTRYPLARGVLATLAVQGVVLAAVAPAVMDNGGMQLTKGEFARQADANCAGLNKFATTLGPYPTALPAQAKWLERFLPTGWDAIVQQGMLVAPPQEQAVARQWMKAMTSSMSSNEALRAAASLGDKEGVKAANALGSRYSKESATLSSRLGLKVCFQ